MGHAPGCLRSARSLGASADLVLGVLDEDEFLQGDSRYRLAGLYRTLKEAAAAFAASAAALSAEAGR